MSKFEVVVIGSSAGGLSALERILERLNPNLVVPIIICQHMASDTGDAMLQLLKKHSVIDMNEPLDKEEVKGNKVYLAPADYHLAIESDKTFSLTQGPRINYSRPSIDVLFETSAEAFLDKTLGIILTGANSDGTNGFKAIKEFGGTTIAQDPVEAMVATMPRSAINAGLADYILTLDEIANFINMNLGEDFSE